MKHLSIIWFLLIVCCSCSPVSKKALDKTFQGMDRKFQDHTGFALYDLEKKKLLYEYKASQYFTPGSNTKIFTFFSCLSILEDSIPALRYIERKDSLIFWGTGDPSFFYKEVADNGRIFSFFKSTSVPLYFSDHNFHTTHFGSGWAWDDYDDYYSAERSSFPIYGNVLSLQREGTEIFVGPPYLKNYVKIGEQEKKAKVIRRLESNEFTFHASPGKQSFKADVPFKVSPELITNLLSDTIRKLVRHVRRPIPKDTRVLYSLPVDSLYKLMMQESDNMIAEQLLLICSQVLSDSLKPEVAIRYMKKNLLSDLLDEPKWVDGSGLSRYNLFTPRSIVQLWDKIYREIPEQRLFALLATGGRSGTIKNWYNAQMPYIFGKTGSLSNNHCLSGYLVTKKGKRMIFSFMNNNFTSSVNDVRRGMETILRTIYENY